MTDSKGPPRKSSVEAIQAGDGSWEVAMRTEIVLDGEVQNHVTAYDCDAGTVTRQVLDERGRPQLNETRDAVQTETVTGDVTVRWKGRP